MSQAPFLFDSAVHGAGVSGPLSEPPAATLESTPGPGNRVRSPNDAMDMARGRAAIESLLRQIGSLVSDDRRKGFFASEITSLVASQTLAIDCVLWRRALCGESSGDAALEVLGATSAPPNESTTEGHHLRLLIETILRENDAAVVPAHEDIADIDPESLSIENPVNLTGAALALVAIPPSPIASEQLCLQCNLPDGMGIGTKRGHLKLMAQIADLISEYFRNQQLRDLERDRRRRDDMDQRVRSYAVLDHRASVLERLVDDIAECFEMHPVAVIRKRSRRDSYQRVVAISHVDQIDRDSPEVKRLVEQANGSKDHEQGDPCFEIPIEFETGDSWLVLAWHSSECEPTDPPFIEGTPGDASLVTPLIKAASDQIRLINAKRQRSAIKLAISRKPSIARLTVAMIFLLGFACLMCFPVPWAMVHEGVLRPASMTRLHAPRESIVQKVHVEHGQHVTEGDLLVELVDPDLQRQVTELIGRSDVLLQRRESIQQDLLSTGSITDENDASWISLETESQIIQTELDSIAKQLDLLRDASNKLNIRADRTGVVVAWQIEQRLPGRPLSQGDPLLELVDDQTDWQVRVNLPHNHLNRWQRRSNDSSEAIVSGIDGMESAMASMDQLGPSLFDESTQSMLASVILSLDRKSDSAFTSKQVVRLSDQPVDVTLSGGNVPLAWWLIEDSFRMLSKKWSLYFGGT
ncbi:MAG: biotin/lipoyl-binding protein [Planctomycetota bacterium]